MLAFMAAGLVLPYVRIIIMLVTAQVKVHAMLIIRYVIGQVRMVVNKMVADYAMARRMFRIVAILLAANAFIIQQDALAQ
jgi:hypothetical protein